MGNIINVLKTCKDSGKAKVQIKNTQKLAKPLFPFYSSLQNKIKIKLGFECVYLM
jgi:hypothetical protein